ncbi:tudor and KH domain-containing protein homolog [Ctenocephalides felis]|nr:tudor and KH domain-containing protein homolog [Ctenocephalides felis]
MVSSHVYAITFFTFLVCGAGGTLIYKLHQRRTKKSRDKILTIRVNRKLGTRLFGEDGKTKKEIEKARNVDITLEDDGCRDMLIIISATSQNDLDICQRIIAKKLKDDDARPSSLRPFKEKIWISLHAYRKLTMNPRLEITSFEYEDNVKIDVEFPRDGRNMAGIQISGDNEQDVMNAKDKIQTKVKEIDELERSLDETSAKRTPRLPTTVNSGSSEVAVPEREKLEPAGADGTMEVYVSALTSPHRFWMQILGPQAAALDNLVETMTEYYNKEENRELHTIISPQVGQIVAAMFNVDGKWYRAQVQEIKPNDYVPCQPVLDLYFVDYGDNCYAAPNEVFELRPDFLTLRFQAIECFLANVSPPNAVDSNDNNYPDESIEKFEQLAHVARWKKLWSRVVSYRERDGAVRAPSPSESLVMKGSNIDRSVREGSPVPGVELYDNEDGRDINIAEELIRGGYARAILPFNGSSFNKLKTNQAGGDDFSKPSAKTTRFEDSSKTDKNSVSSDFVNQEKSATKKQPATTPNVGRKDIVEETKSFISGISDEAVKVVERVKQSTDKGADDSVQSVKDRVAKVQSKLEETKSFIDGISKDAEKIAVDSKNAAKSTSDDIKPKVKSAKERVANKVNNGKISEKSPPKTSKNDEKSSSPKSPLKSEVDFMPTFNKTEKGKKMPQSPSEIKNQATDFLKTERNSKNGI